MKVIPTTIFLMTVIPCRPWTEPPIHTIPSACRDGCGQFTMEFTHYNPEPIILSPVTQPSQVDEVQDVRRIRR